MAYSIYNLILHLALPFILLRLYWRGRKAPAYRQRIAERFGFNGIQVSAGQCLWIHTVSVGEFIAAQPLIRRIQSEQPNLTLIITSMTPTGSTQITQVLGETVEHCYLPYDYSWAQNKLMAAWQPKLLLILETELWPNLLRAAHKHAVPVVIANARLSQKSADGYKKFSSFSRLLMSYIDYIAVQAEPDANRFIDLGLPAERLTVTGSIKSDITVSDLQKKKAKALRRQWGETRSIVMAASTHRGEDEIVLSAFNQLRREISDSLLVLVPRHPERFNEVADLIAQQGFKSTRRSDQLAKTASPVDSEDDNFIAPECSVILADTMGELMVLLGAVDVALVGGSLLPEMGGHNVLEPIAWGKPVIVGPGMRNFQSLFEQLQAVQGIVQVQSAEELATAFANLLRDTSLRTHTIEQSQSVLNANKGALEALVTIVNKQIHKSAAK